MEAAREKEVGRLVLVLIPMLLLMPLMQELNPLLESLHIARTRQEVASVILLLPPSLLLLLLQVASVIVLIGKAVE